MSQQPRLSALLLVVLFQLHCIYAGNGYHYDRPAQPITHSVLNSGSGHHFAPLPTVSPLPPVPALPPLPTGRPGSHVQTQSLLQVHPPPSTLLTGSKSIAAAYRPPSAVNIGNTYIPPSGPAFTRPVTYRSAQVAPQPQTTPGIFGQRIAPAGPSGPAAPIFTYPGTAPSAPSFPPSLSQAPAQPLRIPFGKQAVVHLPPTAAGGSGFEGDGYAAAGRPLKQYAVIEIIDNDIEQNTRPFLTSPFVDVYRAQIGASGTGATPPGVQVNSRSNALVLEQQRFAQQRGGGDQAIALGSGGLGFVRLPNGNVYLGSGSLGYVSGAQHSAEIQDARTRTGSLGPDPLHFGHGALGNPGNTRAFRY